MKQISQKIYFFIFIFFCSHAHGAANFGSHSYNGAHTFNTTAQAASGSTTIVPSDVPHGGTGNSSLTNHGVLLGQGTAPILSLVGTTGTVLIGNTGADASFSATPSVTSITIANLPTAGTDGANKTYVDFFATGLHTHEACVAATTAALTASYSNGASGVGATLTNAGALAAFSLDGQSPTVGQRVLIKNQVSTFQNGIYTVTTVGSGAVAWVLTRAVDHNTPVEITPGDLVPVTAGTININTMWLQTQTVTTIGVDPILFVQIFQQGIVTIAGNSGSVTGTNVTVAGGNNITTTGSSTTMTVNVSGTTDHAVQVGNASASLTSLGIGTNGQVLLGSTGADPSFVTPTTTGTGLNLTTNASTLNYSLATPVSVANGGTGATTLTANGVVVSHGTSAFTATAAGGAGIPLIGNGAADPVFGTAVVAGGGTGVSSLTAYALLAGGTTTTNPVQSLAGVGIAGQLLTSNGAGALPTFQTLPLPLSVYGEILAVQPTAIIQLQFPYNINTDYVSTSVTGAGTVTSSTNFALLQTGASASSSATMLSRQRLHYQASQGCVTMYTALFTTGVANSTQKIGIGNAQDGFFFGFNGTTFGILHRVNSVDTWIPQTSWNQDKFNGSGASGVTLDPTKGNIYKIQYQWFGFGAINFFIENPNTGALVLVHQIQYANANTATSLLNPALQLMAEVINTTNATNVTLKTPSFAGIIEGFVNPDQDTNILSIMVFLVLLM
ncbi:hypothetical protein A3J41_01045 [candidate division TM6 bacterium RIFCSPHIGHO2_12_FULL_38_8]|nr:MAG: hypothetical protein A3J41_01045 [candidate division TM6 bacterium RIFCSPHIGHO2_12_FULL_38_8]